VRLYHIPPARLATQVIPEEENGHLCVADIVLSHREYAEYYRSRSDRGDWLTLDTAAFEGTVTPVRDLLEAALMVRPKEIVLPDLYRDANGTIETSIAAAKELRDYGYDGKFMVVPHGQTWHDYLYCAEYLVTELGEEVCIGLIEEIPELYRMTRCIAVDILSGIFPKAEFHFNGVTEQLDEMFDEEVRARVRSADTSKFVVWGLNGVNVDPIKLLAGVLTVPPYPGRKSLGGRTGFFDKSHASDEALQITRTNINRWRRFLK
jgi:hypothetical protein